MSSSLSTPTPDAAPPLSSRVQGIFGGTFDPVHFGHLRLAEEAIDALGLASVRWIPAGQPAMRDAPRVGARERMEMVRIAIAGNPRFLLDTTEVDRAERSFTVPTLERLRQAADCDADQPLVLLVGADAFAGMPGWHRWEDLLDLVHIGVACRPGYRLDADALPAPLAARLATHRVNSPAAFADRPAGAIATFSMTPLDISATQIRTLLAAGRSPRYLLPDALVSHIQTHHYYQEH